MPGFRDLSPENRSVLVGRLADAADRFLSQLIATGHKVVPQDSVIDRGQFLQDLGWTEEELNDFECWDSDPRLSALRAYALATGQELRLESRAFDRDKPFHMERTVTRQVTKPASRRAGRVIRVEIQASRRDNEWQTLVAGNLQDLQSGRA